MNSILSWNELCKAQRLVVMEHFLTIADEEKKFPDNLGTFLKKEMKRLDGLKRYNGAVPLLFKDHFNLKFELATIKHIQCVVACSNLFNNSELTTTALLLCQAKFSFDEKNLNEVQILRIVEALESVGDKELFKALAIYTRPFKMPKELQTCF